MTNEAYFEIGQRIRKFRKARGLSQEQLAEKIDISTTHMSHIETANTKLSLSVFVDIVEALSIRADDLLFDTPKVGMCDFANEILTMLDGCSTSQAQVVVDVAKTTKQALAAFFPDRVI